MTVLFKSIAVNEESRSELIEMMGQLYELSMRINLETEMACWYEVAGHVGKISIRVSDDKDDWSRQQLFSYNIQYSSIFYDWESKEESEARALENFNKFKEEFKEVMTELNNILGKGFKTIFRAYCNTGEMACHQDFSSEEWAKKWVRKMNKKYKSVSGVMIGHYPLKQEVNL